jgi:hypothetical protein
MFYPISVKNYSASVIIAAAYALSAAIPLSFKKGPGVGPSVSLPHQQGGKRSCPDHRVRDINTLIKTQ